MKNHYSSALHIFALTNCEHDYAHAKASFLLILFGTHNTHTFFHFGIRFSQRGNYRSCVSCSQINLFSSEPLAMIDDAREAPVN